MGKNSALIVVHSYVWSLTLCVQACAFHLPLWWSLKADKHIYSTETYHATQMWCLPASCLPMFSSSFEKRGSPSSRPVCPTALPPLTAFRSASQTAWRLLARTERRESHIRRGTLQLALCVIFTYNWKYLSYIWEGVGGGGKEAIIILWAVEKLKKATASED